MLVYAQGWSLASQFWNHTPPPQKKGVSAAKKMIISHWHWHWKLLFLIQNVGFFCFSANFLSRRSRLSRTSRASSQLIRPRPIDCDRVDPNSRWRFSYKSCWPRQQEKLFIWPPFFQYNKRLLCQNTDGVCFSMPQDGHKLASFEVFPRPKKKISRVALWLCAPTLDFSKKYQTQNCFSSFLAVFIGGFVTPISTLANNKRSC